MTAVPVAYMLGRGGLRTYSLGVAWCVAGILDILYAVAIATQSGPFGAISAFLGVGILVLPIALVIQFAVLGLLMESSVPRYMARTRPI